MSPRLRRRLLWLLAVVLPIGLLVSLPASLVLRSQSSGVSFEQVQGSVWRGHAMLGLPRQSPLPVRWQWSGGLSWDWQVDAPALALRGQWQVNQRSRLSDIHGHIDVQHLDVAQWFVVSWPEGQMQVDIDYVEWVAPDALAAQGELLWHEARLAGLVNESLGEVRVRLKPSTQQSGHTEIEIDSSAEGVVSVSGEVLTNGDRFDAKIALVPNSQRRDVMRFLSALGPTHNGAITIERSGQWGIFQ